MLDSFNLQNFALNRNLLIALLRRILFVLLNFMVAITVFKDY